MLTCVRVLLQLDVTLTDAVLVLLELLVCDPDAVCKGRARIDRPGVHCRERQSSTCRRNSDVRTNQVDSHARSLR